MSTSGRRVVRLTPRTRAALGMRLAERRHPARTSLGQVVVSGLLILVVAVAAIGGSAAIVGSSVVAALASGLPDLADLDHLTFSQPTVIYDRTGKIALARFEQQDRRVVAYADVPPLVVDATTAAEDRTFWVNDGWDPAAIAAAAFQNLGGGRDERGASTITQQLVRAPVAHERDDLGRSLPAQGARDHPVRPAD